MANNKDKKKKNKNKNSDAPSLVEKMVLVRPSVLRRLTDGTASHRHKKVRKPQTTKKHQKRRGRRKKTTTTTTAISQRTKTRKRPSAARRRRAGGPPTARFSHRRWENRAAKDEEDDADDEVTIVASAPPSQIARLRRLRRLRQQLKRAKGGPSWSRSDMLAYQARLRNALENRDLGSAAQASSPTQPRAGGGYSRQGDDNAREEEDYTDSEDDDQERDWYGGEEAGSQDEDADERAVEDVVAIREAVVPPSVAKRARTLLMLVRKTDNGRRVLTWTKGKHELVLNGRRLAGTDIFDLVVHATRDKRAKRPKAGSPGPPPGFGRFARALSKIGAGAGREIMRNKRRWPQLFPATAAASNSNETPKKWLQLRWGERRS